MYKQRRLGEGTLSSALVLMMLQAAWALEHEASASGPAGLEGGVGAILRVGRAPGCCREAALPAGPARCSGSMIADLVVLLKPQRRNSLFTACAAARYMLPALELCDTQQ